jgi:Fe-S-cluster containining protein
MLPSPDDLLRRKDIRAGCFKRLPELLQRMDRAYEEAARHYGFHCSGCDDNCCRTRFYHHTFLEFLYLYTGFKRLDARRQAAIRGNAERYCRALAEAEKRATTLRLMCPLNFDGRCSLYEYRPMICRLHGIPHTLRLPGGGAVNGPGCDAFHRQCGHPSRIVFDRTPHYVSLSGLESEFRQALAVKQRIKLTVAEMILHFNE